MSSMKKALKYLEGRDAGRQRAQAAFIAKHPDFAPLIALANEYVACIVLGLSGCDFSKAKHGLYICDLVVSFARTHFIAQDLIGYGELIEAAVLLRKQMELLARLHELAKADDLEGLLKKTPNMREVGGQFRRLYSAYSEVTHSSDPIHLQLLGRIHVNGKEYTPVYPVYDRNAVVTLKHQLLLVIEFHFWVEPYLNELVKVFSLHEAAELAADLASRYLEEFSSEEKN